MIATSKIEMDLNWYDKPKIEAIQDDKYSRNVEISLVTDGTPWPIPTGATAVVNYVKADGTGGEYDTMPNGEAAWAVSGNVLTVKLAPQVLTAAGAVHMGITLILEHRTINTFQIVINVHKNVAAMLTASENYKHVAGFVPMPTGAVAGQYIKVTEVDADGKVRGTKTVDLDTELKKIEDIEKIKTTLKDKGDNIYKDPETGLLYLRAGTKKLGQGVDFGGLSFDSGYVDADGYIHLTHEDGDAAGFTPFYVGVGTGGLAFDGGYTDEEGYLHLTMNGEDIEDFEPFYVGTGGTGSGDSGSTLTVAMKSSTVMSVAETEDEALIAMVIRSVDSATEVETGDCTLQIYVGTTLKKAATVKQGEVEVNVRPYLTTGTNEVRLVVSDSYGKSATRKCKITVETLTLAWSLGDTERVEGSLAFTLTPTGNYDKKIHVLVDGDEIDGYPVTVSSSGRRRTVSIEEQSHGGHTVSAYCTMEVNGITLTSEILACAVAWVSDEELPAIACCPVATEVERYTTVNLIHRVIDPVNNPATVNYMVNGKVFKTETIDQSEQIWSYRLTTVGEVTLSICCGEQVHAVKVTVTGLGVDVEEITDGLAIKVEPAAISSLRGWSFGEYAFTFSDNFDEVNGGLQNDEDGVRCIRVTAGDRLTLNYPLFAGDARKNGLAAKLVYRVADSSRKDTVAASCTSGGIGLEIQANNVYLRGNQTSIVMSTCEDEKVELDLNIQPDTSDRLMYMWEKASTFSYQQYASNELFTVPSTVGITFGSDDADVYIYLFRAYTRDLTNEEIRANFIADGADTTEILNRKNRNDIYDGQKNVDPYAVAEKNPDVHVIIFHAARMTAGKKDTVVGIYEQIKGSGETDQQFDADAEFTVQGTSSVEHAETAGPNVNVVITSDLRLKDGNTQKGYAMHGADNSIPTTQITFKKNIASEDHIVNRIVSEWYNRYQPVVRPARTADPRVRDCMESAMAVAFFHNTGTTAVQVGPDLVQPDETIFFGLGNICSNKDAVETFQYDPIVIEVRNNTEPQVRFKSDDLSGNNFDNCYEFRYLDESQYTKEDAIAKWQQVQTFVYETDYTAPSGAALDAPVTINGTTYQADSAAYRKARWTAEAPRYFEMETLYHHNNMTLFFLLRDNRAKNMFWSYNPATGKWRLIFAWDHDTGLCRNNEGYVDIEPGYMDWDTYGTGDVYNAADSALFCNLRECNGAELTASYLARESAGAWNMNEINAYIEESQNCICEALWIEDAEHNAIRTLQNLGTAAYLERATGKLRLHLKKALLFQKAMIDSYYNATACTSDSAAFRGYTPDTWIGVAPTGVVELTFYTDMWCNVLAGSIPYRERVFAGQTITLDLSAHLNETEIYFRSAAWIQAFGDLSGLYLGQFEASRLKRVRKLLIGSSIKGYYNTNFEIATFTNCKKLEEVNLGGLTSATMAFDFTPNLYLKKLYTAGSGVTGITVAPNGRLETAQLNALSAITMKNLHRLKTFSMEGYGNLTYINIENCPAVDTYTMAAGAEILARVRLVDIAWDVKTAAYEILMRLYNTQGVGDDGYATENGVLTGVVNFSTISPTKYNTIVSTIPTIEFSYGQFLEEYTVTYCNWDGTVVYSVQVEEGGNAPDPVALGLIPKPTRPADESAVYTYYKWDKALTNITADTTVTAVYMAQEIWYTVNWYNGNGDLVQTNSVIAHGSCSYTGDTSALEIEGRIWVGWKSNPSDVVENMDIFADYVVPTLPAVKDPAGYDFIYSDVATDSMCYTRDEFAGIVMSDSIKQYLSPSDRIKMVTQGRAITDTEIVFRLENFYQYKLADGSGTFARSAWAANGVLNLNRQMQTTNTNAGGYEATLICAFLDDDLSGFPTAITPFWAGMIKTVLVRSIGGDALNEVLEVPHKFYLLGAHEIGLGGNENEIDDAAEIKVSPIYTSNKPRIRTKNNKNGLSDDITRGEHWWTRTPNASGSTQFKGVDNNGISTNYNTSNSNGVAPGFCI